MNIPFHFHWNSWKTRVTLGIGLLCLLDGGLLYFQWQIEKTPAAELRAQQANLQREAKLVTDDVKQARAIRQHMPEVARQASQFYESDLMALGTGYSSLAADLTSIAAKSGVHTKDFSFKQKALMDQGVTQVDISTEVEGNYTQLIQFINELQRSKNFYLVNELTLDSGEMAGIRLKLELMTYFRS